MMANTGSSTVSTRRATAVLVALSVSTFTYVTTEALPVGLLTVIAADLGRSQSDIGLLVTGYAAVVVLASLPLTRLTQRVPRRYLLAGTLGGFVLGSLVTAAAPGYPVLLVARLLMGLTHALFWSVVVAAVTGLFPPQVRGRVVARLAVGTSLAPVLGVPLGTWVGQQAGWRTAFLLMAVLGLAACVTVSVALPTFAPQDGGAARGSAPDARRYALLVAATALGVTGFFTAYTYITPFLLDVSGFGTAALGPLLFVVGCSGLVGTLTAGPVLDRWPWPAVVAPLATLAGALLVLYALGTVKPVAVAAIALLGMAISVLVAALMNRTLHVAPGSTDLAAAGSSSAFNVGIAAGSFLGGQLVDGAGVRGVALVGAGLTALACAVMLAEPRLARPRPAPGEPAQQPALQDVNA